ncbi:MAG: M20 aminoacylase family protein [Psychrobium sp.]
MSISNSVLEMHPTVTTWRRDIHAHPETAFEEHRTSDFVASKLEEFGIEVHRGIGKTGLVGVLKAGSGDKKIGLRADMDALFIKEENEFEHCSKIEGKMHACGHDGHTAILLGAAKELAETKNFNGTVFFIFQPAEETGNELCGGSAMIKDGLFERFPADCIFALHNFPSLPLGQVAVRKGPMLASVDTFEVKITSEHTHAYGQHLTPDPLLTAAKLVESFHALKARYIDPADNVILTITQFQAGDPINDEPGVHVGPSEALFRGTIYTLNEAIRDDIQAQLGKLVKGIASTYDAGYKFDYQRGYPVMVNSPAETEFAVKVAQSVVGVDNVEPDMKPIMGAEDFSFMLREKPGCYIALGTAGDEPGVLPCQLHNPHYDFNDKVIPQGVQYFVNLANRYLTD